MAPDRIAAAQAAALFASDLSSRCRPSQADVADAIRNAVAAHGGVHACACMVAAAYGDCPETAVPRMQWARQTVQSAYSSTSALALATV